MKKKKKEMKKSQIFQIVNCQKFAVSLKCTIRCEPFPMGLINSLHHHKSTLAVTVAEFYVFAACAHFCVFMCVFFFSLSRGARTNSLGILWLLNCNCSLLALKLSANSLFSAMFVVNWHFYLQNHFLLAGKHKNYSNAL